MGFESIAAARRAIQWPNLWGWLISATLHLLLLLHWPSWHASAAATPRAPIHLGTANRLVHTPHLPDTPAPQDLQNQTRSVGARASTQAANLATEPTALPSPPSTEPSQPTRASFEPSEVLSPPIAATPDTPDVLLAQATQALSGGSATDAASAHTMGSYRAPSGARLRYDLQGIAKGFGYSAKAELLWQPDAGQYDARLEVSHFLLGSRVQTSQGQLTAEGLLPRRFGDKVRSEQAAHFQRDKGLITYSSNTPDAVLLAGTQDRLSVFLQISGLLAAEPKRWGPGAVMSFNTTGARDTEVWAFQLSGAEQLKMPFGALDAIRLVRQEQKQYDQRVELWMAPSLDHLPVRIRITQTNGDQVDLLLRSKELPNAKP